MTYVPRFLFAPVSPQTPPPSNIYNRNSSTLYHPIRAENKSDITNHILLCIPFITFNGMIFIFIYQLSLTIFFYSSVLCVLWFWFYFYLVLLLHFFQVVNIIVLILYRTGYGGDFLGVGGTWNLNEEKNADAEIVASGVFVGFMIYTSVQLITFCFGTTAHKRYNNNNYQTGGV